MTLKFKIWFNVTS